MIAVDLGEGRSGHIVPGLSCEPAPGAVDVMRGEETLAFGAGVEDGLVCLLGTHPKWVEMRGGRVQRFATYLTGEMYALLRHHSMVGRPATEPEDPGGFELGLAAAERNGGAGRVGLLHLLFGARAATVTGRLPPAALGPYISGLLTGDEINGAFAQFEKPEASRSSPTRRAPICSPRRWHGTGSAPLRSRPSMRSSEESAGSSGLAPDLHCAPVRCGAAAWRRGHTIRSFHPATRRPGKGHGCVRPRSYSPIKASRRSAPAWRSASRASRKNSATRTKQQGHQACHSRLRWSSICSS